MNISEIFRDENIIICPVCKERLYRKEKALCCSSGHSFDVAKEGYVNLLTGNKKSGSLTGDNKTMALCRHAFLEKGYYSCLKDALQNEFGDIKGNVLDICCGEGYYTDALSGSSKTVYAFDLSKEMVKLAAKRKNSSAFVANIASIPLESGSVNGAIHLFAPFHDREFSRIMSKDGVLFTVVPGKNHLMGMKQVLYEKPYENDEAPPLCDSFEITDKIKVSNTVTVSGSGNISAMLDMTPYSVHSPKEGIARLKSLDTLKTEVEFVIYRCVLKG